MIITSYDVFCDRCNRWTGGDTGVHPSKIEARAVARHQGWKKIGTEDVCPGCLHDTKHPNSVEGCQDCRVRTWEKAPI